VHRTRAALATIGSRRPQDPCGRVSGGRALPLAEPVLAFSPGASGLAAGPVLVVIVIQPRRAHMNNIPLTLPSPPKGGQGEQ
jgi:hypothetical protein